MRSNLAAYRHPLPPPPPCCNSHFLLLILADSHDDGFSFQSCAVQPPARCAMRCRARASRACTRSLASAALRLLLRLSCVESLQLDSSRVQGYGATILAFGPFSALYFMIYEQLKTQAQSLRGGSGTPLNPLHFVACAAIAGGTAAPPPPFPSVSSEGALVIFAFQAVPAS